MNIAKDKNVQDLIKTFDLDAPEYYFEVTDYYEIDNHIVIEKIQVLDSKGKKVRLADNKKIINGLHKYPIRFVK